MVSIFNCMMALMVATLVSACSISDSPEVSSDTGAPDISSGGEAAPVGPDTVDPFGAQADTAESLTMFLSSRDAGERGAEGCLCGLGA